jgi:hypothetical protein
MVSLTSSDNQHRGWLVQFVFVVQFVQLVKLFAAPTFSIVIGGQARMAAGSCALRRSKPETSRR